MKKAQTPEAPGENEAASLHFRVGAILFLAGIFFSNMLARIILAPMMPLIEKDLKLGHDQAGGLVFTATLGYSLMLLGSGFVSARLTHRRTVGLSGIAVGGAAAIVFLSHDLWGMRFGLFLLGMSAALYFPSGIATITGLVVSRDWGKAMAIHELAPNLSFILAPLLVEVLLRWCSWRQTILLSGIVCLLMGIVFLRYGKGGGFPGEAPNLRTLRVILADRSFWLMMLFFCLIIGVAFGVYSMLPLYLVAERGVARGWANTWVGLSRIPTLITSLLAGWAADRLGLKYTMKVLLLSTGILTILLGIVPGDWFVPIVFLQAICSTAYFPVGFATLSRISSSEVKNVAVSLTVPVSVLVGAGAIPAGLGIAGELGSFSVGFAILGGCFLAVSFLVGRLELPDKQ